MKTHCRRGHLLISDDTYIEPSGKIKCRVCRKISRKQFNLLYPWTKHFRGAKSRCQCKGNTRYAIYGGSGIKLLATRNDFKFLWFRDKAYLMKSPSIDRINNKGNYEISNCQFIERSENTGKDNRGEKHHNSKLTTSNVVKIRKLSKKGVCNSILSKRFKVSCSVVWNVVNLKTWKHVK